MKARVITAQQKQIIKQAADIAFSEQVEDITNRTQCMVFAAMLNAGLSVRTVNRVIAQMPDVIKAYGEMRKEGLADWDLVHGLIERGVNVRMVKHEL